VKGKKKEKHIYQIKAKNESKRARKTRQPCPWDMNTMTTI
jgi:hypothetical protein